MTLPRLNGGVAPMRANVVTSRHGEQYQQNRTNERRRSSNRPADYLVMIGVMVVMRVFAIGFCVVWCARRVRGLSVDRNDMSVLMMDDGQRELECQRDKR